VIFDVAFGVDLESEEDPYFKLADQMGYIISNHGTTGISLLDIVPRGKAIHIGVVGVAY